jgi:hypothetical protein
VRRISTFTIRDAILQARQSSVEVQIDPFECREIPPNVACTQESRFMTFADSSAAKNDQRELNHSRMLVIGLDSRIRKEWSGQ